MIFLFAESPCSSTTYPRTSSSPRSITSVTSAQPATRTITVVSRYGVARASTNPTTQTAIPSTARKPVRRFIPSSLARLAATRPRDKLLVPALRFLAAELAWRPFGFHLHTGASDSAVWPRQTQRSPRGVHQWLLRSAASWPHSQPRTRPQLGRRARRRLEQRRQRPATQRRRAPADSRRRARGNFSRTRMCRRRIDF